MRDTEHRSGEKNRVISGVSWIVTGIALDQISKWFVRTKVVSVKTCAVTSFFDVVYVWNPGISWGFFHQHHAWKRFFLLMLPAVMSVFLWYLYRREKGIWQGKAYLFILSGALGNLVDRFFFDAVFDFLSFHWGGWYFPAFNLADMLISIGFLIILSEQYQWNYLKKSKT